MSKESAIEAAAAALERVDWGAHPSVAATEAVDAALPHLLEELTQRHHLVEQFLRGSQACSCGKDRFCRDMRILEGLLADKEDGA